MGDTSYIIDKITFLTKQFSYAVQEWKSHDQFMLEALKTVEQLFLPGDSKHNLVITVAGKLPGPILQWREAAKEANAIPIEVISRQNLQRKVYGVMQATNDSSRNS